MRRWKPKPALGLWLGVILLLLALAGAGYMLTRLAAVLLQPPETWAVNLDLYGELLVLIGLLALAGVLAYRVAGALTLYYQLDRNAIYIHWLGNRAIVPMTRIERVDSGIPGARMPWRLVQGIGYYWGQGRTAEGRRLYQYATRRPARSLIVQTSDEAYAISPREQDAFVQDLEQRRKLGVVKPLAATVETGRAFSYAFWNDYVARWALLLALLLNLVLLGVLAARYPDLAAVVDLRFDAAGQATELRPRYQVLFLPLAALLLLLLNAGLGMFVYRREPFGARMLQVASVVIQVLFGVAIVSILLR